MRRVTQLPVLLIAAGGIIVGLAVPATAHEASKLINGKTIAKHSIAGNRLKNNTVTGKQVKESTLGTVPRATTAHKALTLPALVWHPITSFDNGWGNFSGVTSRPAGYAVDAQGIVHLRGVISGGTGNEAAFTLPSTDLPAASAEIQIPVATHGLTTGAVIIESTGVFPEDGAASSDDATVATSLDGVEYSPAG